MRAWHVTSRTEVEQGVEFSTSSWARSHGWEARWNGTKVKAEGVDEVISEIEQLLGSAGDGPQALGALRNLMVCGSTASENIKEYVFECIRLSEFPAHPSRTKCIFCWPHETKDPLTSARKMGLLSGGAKNLLQLELLDPAGAHLADPGLLDCNGLPPSGMEEKARLYWGPPAPPIEPEILYEGAVRVVSVKPISDSG